MRARARTASADHPRIRGEHPGIPSHSGKWSGSSPHTRGAPSNAVPKPSTTRIIPAYAGSTISWSSQPPEAADHPRIRGEHAQGGIGKLKQGGSSPHTRGAPSRPVLAVPGIGIIPAYAGSTPSGTTLGGISRDHPRIRGEHPWFIDSRGWLAGSSPHTRGAPPTCPRRASP